MSKDAAWIIIDPPVGPYGPREGIEAWIERLKALRDEFTKPDVVASFNALIQEAEEWLGDSRRP